MSQSKTTEERVEGFDQWYKNLRGPYSSSRDLMEKAYDRIANPVQNKYIET